jgi:alcohol dehydrogenase class IV
VSVESISNVNSNPDCDTLTVQKGEELNCEVLVFMGGGSEAHNFSTLLLNLISGYPKYLVSYLLYGIKSRIL